MYQCQASIHTKEITALTVFGWPVALLDHTASGMQQELWLIKFKVLQV